MVVTRQIMNKKGEEEPNNTRMTDGLNESLFATIPHALFQKSICLLINIAQCLSHLELCNKGYVKGGHAQSSMFSSRYLENPLEAKRYLRSKSLSKTQVY